MRLYHKLVHKCVCVSLCEREREREREREKVMEKIIWRKLSKRRLENGEGDEKGKEEERGSGVWCYRESIGGNKSSIRLSLCSAKPSRGRIRFHSIHTELWPLELSAIVPSTFAKANMDKDN